MAPQEELENTNIWSLLMRQKLIQFIIYLHKYLHLYLILH